MNKQTATIVDLATGEITEIPRAELSDQMVPAKIAGIHGTVWVDIQQALERRATKSHHGPFRGALRKKVKMIASLFSEVFPLSYEQWEKRFRSEANPDQETNIWLRSGTIFAAFCRERQLGLSQRRELSKLLFQCQMCSPEELAAVRTKIDLPDEIGDDFARRYYSPSLPETVTVTDPEILELLRQAEVIIAFDPTDKSQTLIFGAEALERIVRQNRTETIRVARVSYKGTEQLESLKRMVRQEKGGLA